VWGAAGVEEAEVEEGEEGEHAAGERRSGSARGEGRVRALMTAKQAPVAGCVGGFGGARKGAIEPRGR
jgi:hypothetical protein